LSSALSTLPWASSFLRLPERVALKCLEEPFLYHIGRDELYEIDDRAKDFLTQCDGTRRGDELTSDAEFVNYCLSEGLLELLSHPDRRPVAVNEPANPSLRYLELQLLERCNLRCRHCYIGAGRSDVLALPDALNVARQFASMGGLRLMISGGEPLLYKDLQAFIEQTADLSVRRVLLSNGTLIHPENVIWLKVDEIQFSLDGWKKGHDNLRGSGAFERTVQGIHAAKEAGIAISVATMVHRENLDEFERMRDFLVEIGAIEWGIDYPVLAGSLVEHRDLIVSYEEAAPLMAFAYGGGYHGSSDGYACGRHFLTVMPTGQAVKCGFYRDSVLGDARRSLRNCWEKLDHLPLSSLSCHNCPVIEECAGGCRFRAPNPLSPDLFMCTLYGVAR
jgi:radical SAM protein with 4Fe4S-binding SPASM domain